MAFIAGHHNKTPFVAFVEEQRPKLKEANPNLSFSELHQHLKAKWNQLSDAEKQKYHNGHDVDINDVSFHDILKVALVDSGCAKTLLWEKLMNDPLGSALIYKFFGFKYVPEGDFYTTGEHSIQSYLGWHDFYDKLGEAAGFKLDATNDPNIQFTYAETGETYRLELWKGSYGWGWGGEVGLYTKDPHSSHGLRKLLEKIPGYFSSAKGKDEIQTVMSIYEKQHPEHVYFTNDGQGSDGTDKREYWNLAIRSGAHMSADHLGMRARIYVIDQGVRKGLFEAMQRYAAVYSEFKPFEREDGWLEFTWDK